MKDKEINNFIRETGKMGDIWTKEQVKDVYQNVSLEEALADRQRSYEGHAWLDEETMKEESSDIELNGLSDKQIVDLLREVNQEVIQSAGIIYMWWGTKYVTM